MDFNKAQKKAIAHTDGPALVLAGPGSGKTAVITNRVSHLIDDCGVKPSKILVITFTKAAAVEMKQRHLSLRGTKSTRVTFGTFHAVFFSVLKHAYHYTAQNIIREEQKYQFMKELVNQMHLEYEDEGEFIASLLGEVSLIKNTGISLENYYAKNCGEKEFREIYTKYQNCLYRNRLLDFDDMLVYCYELFRERPDILAAWQKKFSYILIDEFQDINRLQFEIVKMLAAPENNLFVVGDDDQSIYRFRGAKPEIMLNFKKDYPDAKEILLNVNYRSRKKITTTSLQVINQNKDRFSKKIRSFRPEQGTVTFEVFDDQWQESRRVINSIQYYVKRGVAFEEIAILFRTNTQPRILMEQLMEYNIPFKTKDKIPNLYDHWIARDILTYFKLAFGGRKRSDFLQIMNRPKRYLSRDSLAKETVSFEEWKNYYEAQQQPWVAERIEKLECDLKVLTRVTPFAAINYIRKGIGYDDYLTEYAAYRKLKPEELFETLDELQDGARGYRNYDEWLNHIEEYSKELEKQQKQKNELPNSVSLATLHSSKGLEYAVVYIIDVNEGMMPYKKAVFDAEIEEERRLFYVGMTRAKDALHLSAVRKMNGHEMDGSRFIEEAGFALEQTENKSPER
ncbi:MAG: ATP-dependent helicase [Lachnospiraceae bacterium]